MTLQGTVSVTFGLWLAPREEAVACDKGLMTLVQFFGVLVARFVQTGLYARAIASASSWCAWAVAAYLGLTLFLLEGVWELSQPPGSGVGAS